MNDTSWITQARKYVGLREVPGKLHNKTILKWWTLIRAPFTDDETPWCAGFVGGVLEEVGIKSSRSAAARSYLKWGFGLSKPVPGAIVVFERGPIYGHVGFVLGRDKYGNLVVLGGNQGNIVSIKSFPLSRVLDYRWPAGIPVSVAPLPILTSTGTSTGEA